MSISAMKYALDVLDNYVEDPRCETHRATAVHFLEQAIAEVEDAVAAEREACALSCEKFYWYNGKEQAQEIRARGSDLAKVGEVGVWGEEKNT
jgi:hypothetical protein